MNGLASPSSAPLSSAPPSPSSVGRMPIDRPPASRAPRAAPSMTPPLPPPITPRMGGLRTASPLLSAGPAGRDAWREIPLLLQEGREPLDLALRIGQQARHAVQVCAPAAPLQLR